MRRSPRRLAVALVLVLVHLAISAVHGVAHQRLGIGLLRGEDLFVGIDSVALPLVAAVLLLTKWRRVGGWLLAISMAGAFVFGVDKHFIAAGTDNAFGVASGLWGATFQVTAFLLAAIEAVACWAGIGAARDSDLNSKARS